MAEIRGNKMLNESVEVKKELLEEMSRHLNRGLSHMSDFNFFAAKELFLRVKTGLSILKMEIENNG